MSDIVKDLTNYRIKGIEKAEVEYYEALTRTLDKIEDQIVSLVDRDLPRQAGKLIELQSAVAIRPKIKAILDKEYLPFADRVVRKGFSAQAKRVERQFKTIGLIPPEFQELTKGDLALVKNLKQQYYTQFKDVSNNFTRILSDKVYQNTLVGTEFTVLEKELRESINGIYATSRDPAVNRLVNYVKRNRDNPRLKARVDSAIKQLQSKYARTRTGENMKRYAGQILNDSLRDFDATLNFNKSKDAGLTFVKYYGDVIPTTRDLCRRMVNGQLNKRKNGLFTIAEIQDIWTSRSWSGKKGGNPMIVRGGYNCRHQFSYVNPDWYEDDGKESEILEPVKKPKISTTALATSLARPIKIKDMKIEKTSVNQASLQKTISESAKDKRYLTTQKFGQTVPLSRFNTDGVGTVNLRGMSDKASSMVATIVKELNELADKYKVPRIREITASRRMSAIASMGDGMLTVNPKYFENVLNTKVFTNMVNEDNLSNFKLGTDVSKEIVKFPKRVTLEEYRRIKATHIRPHNAFNYFTDELDKVRNILYHEFGHQIHQMRFIEKADVIKEYLENEYRFISPIEKKLASIRIKGTSATRYTEKNTKEWFAENFSLYVMDKKDLVDPNFIKFFESEVM